MLCSAAVCCDAHAVIYRIKTEIKTENDMMDGEPPAKRSRMRVMQEEEPSQAGAGSPSEGEVTLEREAGRISEDSEVTEQEEGGERPDSPDSITLIVKLEPLSEDSDTAEISEDTDSSQREKESGEATEMVSESRKRKKL